jgi:hypothetical protein
MSDLESTWNQEGGTPILAGGCACGAVRYRLTAPPLIVHACHCRDCQRLTGGAFVINILIEREFAKTSGASPRSFELETPSGSGQEVSFCGACGTTLWSRYRVAPGHLLFVRAGTLDTPDAVEPDVHIYVRTKLPWLELPRDARAFEAIYETEKVWTAESRERVRRHLARRSAAAAATTAG